MCLCEDVLYIQIKKWHVKFGATGSLKGNILIHSYCIGIELSAELKLLFFKLQFYSYYKLKYSQAI